MKVIEYVVRFHPSALDGGAWWKFAGDRLLFFYISGIACFGVSRFFTPLYEIFFKPFAVDGHGYAEHVDNVCQRKVLQAVGGKVAVRVDPDVKGTAFEHESFVGRDVFFREFCANLCAYHTE